MFEDPLFWILVLPGLLLGVYAQSRIKINTAKYSQVRTKDGITGGQVARLLLDSPKQVRGDGQTSGSNLG
jgi:Zn-dependent membrane protease YugP